MAPLPKFASFLLDSAGEHHPLKQGLRLNQSVYRAFGSSHSTDNSNTQRLFAREYHPLKQKLERFTIAFIKGERIRSIKHRLGGDRHRKTFHLFG